MGKQEKGSGLYKFNNVLVTARSDDLPIPSTLSSLELLDRARTENKIFKFKENINFFIYKSDIDGDPSLTIIFTLELPGPPSGSSASSEIIMNLIAFLEKRLLPIDYYNLQKNVEVNGESNLSILTIKRKLRETDII